MKKLFIYALMCAAAAATVSCQDKKDDNGNGNGGKTEIPEGSITTDPGVTINGVIFATVNVDKPGTFAEKDTDYGYYYQFGRKTGWFLAVGENPVSYPVGTFFTSPLSDPFDPEGNWKPENDPCPNGWHAALIGDLIKLVDTSKVTHAFAPKDGVAGMTFTDIASGEKVFFPAGGYGDYYNDGTYNVLGDQGRYWSGTAFGAIGGATTPNAGFFFHFADGWVFPAEGSNLDNANEKEARYTADLMSVRCVKNA